jgi:pimeloyl-ACP methyl ester carboxylesterase
MRESGKRSRPVTYHSWGHLDRGIGPMLELVDRGSCTDAHPTPLLFVHGACHAAWCWDAHFLDYFADRGFRALAVSLRGHGGSGLDGKPLNACSIADYVEDVRSVISRLPADPVLVGHSMGGFIVQKYLESASAPAAVLMSSAPPRTWFMRSMWAGRRHPWLAVKSTVTRNALALYPEPAMVREGLFSPRTPEPVVQECFERIQRESFRALTTDMGFRDLIRTRLVTTPLLVLEGEQVSWGRHVARDIARTYRTEAEYFTDMGHNMMLEPGWQAVAERIDSWLGGQGL